MPLDVNELRGFYASPLGDVARRLIGRVLREPVPHPLIFPEKKYLGLPLDKPLLGFGRACALADAGRRAPLLGIHVVEGALDYAVTQEWSLPLYNLALLGTHASRQQLSGLLWLHERSGGLPFYPTSSRP